VEDQDKDNNEEFSMVVTEQDILKAFDTSEDPLLTTTDLAKQLSVSSQALKQQLEQMHERNLLNKRETCASETVWHAEVAPKLSQEAVDRVESAVPGYTRTLDELRREFSS
jgi:DNA-binding MarR family transcriptional regulator